MRSLKVRPSNMRNGDRLIDGREVSHVSRVGNSGYTIMMNGRAIFFTIGEPSNDPVPIRRQSWQSVKGANLKIGDRMLSGGAVFTITAFEPREGWVAVICDWGHEFRLDKAQPYSVWR